MEKQEMEGLAGFKLPLYTEIPDVGLYLEQVARYVTDVLSPLQSVSITTSMISNYVKKDLVRNPVKKQYGRDQIAWIIFIAASKLVISMEEIQVLVEICKNKYSAESAYLFFKRTFEQALRDVFGGKEAVSGSGKEEVPELDLLHKITILIAYKLFLDQGFRELEAGLGEQK